MSSENTPMNFGESIWDDDPYIRAMNLVAKAGELLSDIAASGHAPGDPQASAVSAERVVELERQLGAVSFALRAEGADPVRAAELVREAADEALGRLHDVEQQLAVADATVRSMTDLLEREHQNVKNARTACDELLATAYVAREVPWTDVAAGMMTLSKEEHPRPWMVESRGYDADNAFVILRNGEKTFEKTLADPGETVRVLVPYVTPEQAEALVVSELGGRA